MLRLAVAATSPCTEFGARDIAAAEGTFLQSLLMLRAALAATDEFKDKGNQWISRPASKLGARASVQITQCDSMRARQEASHGCAALSGLLDAKGSGGRR